MYTSRMHKKSLIPAVILGIVVASVIVFKFLPPTLLKKDSATSKPVADLNFHGFLVTTGISASEITEKYKLSETAAKYQVVNSNPETNTERRYLLTKFTSQETADRFAAIAANKIMGCIEVIPAELAVPPTNTDYLSDFTLVTVQDFSFTDNPSCYAEQKNLFTSYQNSETDQKTIAITTPVQVVERPVYDIHYDFAIDAAWGEAQKLGYSDASGLEHPADQLTKIFVVPADDDIAYQLTQAARTSEPVGLKGYFTGGFAESTILVVTTVQ